MTSQASSTLAGVASPAQQKTALRRVLSSAAIGQFVEWYDFVIYAYSAAIIAKLMPVLPLVASTMVAPSRSFPERSASSNIASAGRSLTLPPGLANSHFAQTVAPPSGENRARRTSGVPAISPSTSSATK